MNIPSLAVDFSHETTLSNGQTHRATVSLEAYGAVACNNRLGYYLKSDYVIYAPVGEDREVELELADRLLPLCENFNSKSL